MRRWYDALAEYKLQQGSYCKKGVDAACEELPDGFDLGVNWPSDWKNGNNACGDNRACGNDYWTECHANEEGTGYVYCRHTEDHNNEFIIYKIQPDDYDIYPDYIGMTICMFRGKGEKVCKALGGNKIDGDVYQL